MALTDTTIRQAKADYADRKLADEKGLYLLVTATGSKLWRFKYRIDGKEKKLALGAYPDVSLEYASASARRRAGRRTRAATLAPSSGRRASPSASHRQTPLRRLLRNISPSWKRKGVQASLSARRVGSWGSCRPRLARALLPISRRTSCWRC